MDMFSQIFGPDVDLDDLSTYPEEWLTISMHDLWRMCWTAGGKSLFYMHYFWPNEFINTEQYKRVDKLCEELVGEDGEKRLWKDGDRLTIMKWLFRFQEEVENQC